MVPIVFTLEKFCYIRKIKMDLFLSRHLGECVEKFDGGETRHYSKYNRQETCEENGGEWLMFHNYLEKAPQHTSQSACEAASGNGIRYFWGRPMNSREEMCLVALDEPACAQAPYTRDNHLGNGDGNKGVYYDWELPHFPSLKKQTCVLRIRCVMQFNSMSHLYF